MPAKLQDAPARLRSVPRLRIIAGPNGSGKSTIKSRIPSEILGFYINPDDIEKQLRSQWSVDLSAFRVTDFSDEALTDKIVSFFDRAALWGSTGLPTASGRVRIIEGRAVFNGITDASYLASMVADFIRSQLLEAKASFTFETVMSHPGKVELLEKAKKSGYRTYLYYIATEDPEINVARVRNRVRDGGHSVPEEKIRERYVRSLELLLPAIQRTDRAYIFDNSGDGTENILISEITEGQDVVAKHDPLPAWFVQYVWDKAVDKKKARKSGL